MPLLLVAVLLLGLAFTPRAAGSIYWANDKGSAIGTANIDGTGVNQSFITAGPNPCGVAADGAHLYWGDSGDGTIGRSNLDGAGMNANFVGAGNVPCGVAVDGAHLYWANGDDGTIGRSNLDGTGANQSFIGGGNRPCGVAVDGAHLYWANGDDGTIGRSNLDGTGANQSFIGGATGPCGVAVDVPPSAASPAPPSNVFTLGKPKLNQRRGTAQLPVTVPGPGELVLSGNGVKAARAVRVTAARAEAPVRLLIAAMGATRRRLNRTGKFTVRPTVTYTPDGGDPGTRSTKVRLVKR